MIEAPFHQGELDAQRLAGRGPGGTSIRDFMPDQHRSFYELLHFMVAGVLDQDGWPHATLLTGSPGFVTSPDPRTLHIAGGPDPLDPAAPGFAPGSQVGLLGIDLGTRRRNRANGRITSADGGKLVVAIHQSFGNCPQYIQTRDVSVVEATPRPAEPIAGIDAGARALIEAADTFFIATSSGPGAGEQGGVDASHRGGRPGFVHVDGQTLTIPDFKGNRYYNTLGNLLQEPRTGLLFVDFASGDLLCLQGTAEVLWDAGAARMFPGAELLWRVRVVRGWRRPGALPQRWAFREFAPTTERTGTWSGLDVRP